MRAVLGSKECWLRLQRATGARVTTRTPNRIRLKARYNAWLSRTQDVQTLTTRNGPELVQNARIERRLMRTFLYPDGGNGRGNPVDEALLAKIALQRDADRVRETAARVSAAQRRLGERDPDLGALFEVVVNRIILANCKEICGGSVNDSIGLVWANPPRRATDDDLVEMLAHELAHTLTYVDERYDPHYASGQLAHELVAVSAIRAAPRPVYHAMHSLLVALELLELRACDGKPMEVRLHPSSERLRASCTETITSIRALPLTRVFTRHGLAFFHGCEDALDRLS